MQDRKLMPNDEGDEVWAKISAKAMRRFAEVEKAGEAAEPIPFPEPSFHRGTRSEIHVRKGGKAYQTIALHRNQNPEYAYLEVQDKPRVHTRLGYVMFCIVLNRVWRSGEAGADKEEEPFLFEFPSELRVVAVKMNYRTLIRQSRERGAAEDPYKEVAALQMLGDNEHVLGCNEVLRDKKYLYVVMPFCAGGDLFTHVYEERDGGMPEPLARWYFRHLLRCLHYMQGEGVCHRDLSTENIMYDNNFQCVMIDLGMALRVPHIDGQRRLLRPQGACGKLPYMAPEVYASKENFDGFAADLWSVAVILFALLTGNFESDRHTGKRIIYEIPDDTDIDFRDLVRPEVAGLKQILQRWQLSMSDEAVDLLQSIFQRDPRQRLSLNQVMQHPWVVDPNVISPEESDWFKR